ncbi:MAG: twin-arginine translocase subunit TatC [Verrucomicrobiaceae bacterium]|nr:MAG: twin-arginine translocase subunit TatC [Verrucomicrobiaceae bacterium]
MYLLKKVIQLRENSHPDHEKPFLEHLEDLRVMITRVVVTLIVSMVVCFMFQKQLMEVLRRPVEQVWITQLQEKLPQDTAEAPKPLDVDAWEQAKSLEHAAAGLDAGQRELFYQSSDPESAFHAKSVALLRAVLALPEENRADFLAALDVPADLRRQVEALVKSAPSPEVDGRGNLRLMSALKPTETFMLSMKLSFFAGIIVAFPLLLMFVLQFVLPGLHANEKRLLWPAMLVGFGLFLGGVLFAYYAVLPRALLFFYEWSGNLGVSNDWRIGEYISFATQFTLLFGLSFELPVVVMVFVKLGLLSYETMSRTRSYAILGIFVTAAILTPTPDAFTLVLMALPMMLLYELCIWLAWLDRRKNRIAEEQEAREREERLLAAGPAVPPQADDAPQPDIPVDEPGDDGWTDDYEQQEFHDFPELPETPPAGDDPPDKP